MIINQHEYFEKAIGFLSEISTILFFFLQQLYTSYAFVHFVW